MPRKDPDERRAYNREWMTRRRAEWMAAHPCPCGAPSTTIMVDAGTHKVSWSWSAERLEATMAAKRVRCDGCAAAERVADSEAAAEVRAERARESNREYMRRRRAAVSNPDPEPVPEPEPRAATETGRRKAAARPRKPSAPVTVFDDPEWRRQRKAARQARRRARGMAVADDD